MNYFWVQGAIIWVCDFFLRAIKWIVWKNLDVSDNYNWKCRQLRVEGDVFSRELTFEIWFVTNVGRNIIQSRDITQTMRPTTKRLIMMKCFNPELLSMPDERSCSPLGIKSLVLLLFILTCLLLCCLSLVLLKIKHMFAVLCNYS